MPIPTEPVGSLPRPMKLQAAYAAYDAGETDFEALTAEQDAACLDSIKRMEETGSPIVSTASSAPRASRPIPSPIPWPGPASPTTSPGTASTSPSSPMAITASCRG